MRRIAPFLLVAAVILADFGARLRAAWMCQPDIPQWLPIVSTAALAAFVTGAVLALLASACRRPGGSIGVLLAAGTVQVLIALTDSSPTAADTWRWSAPWLIALAGAAWLPGAFSIARTAELSFRGGRTFACSYRLAALVAFILLSLLAASVAPVRHAVFPESGPNAVVRLSTAAPLATEFPFATVEARATATAIDPDAVALVTANRRFPPFGGHLLPDGRLHRINFRPPTGPFQFQAAAGVTLGPAYAYSSRVRFAGKMIESWRMLVAIAGLLAVAGLAAARRSAPFLWWFGWDATETRVLPLLLLLPYLAVAASHLDTYAGGSDSSGYLNSARLLRHGHLLAPLRRADAAADGTRLADSVFVPNGFVLHSGPALAPSYPPGLPLLIASASVILPERGAVAAVILVHLLAGILLLYRCGRLLGLEPGLAGGTAAVLALCPVYLFMGLQPMSDVPALVWVLLAIYLALAPARPAACGMATAMAVLLRPSDILIVPVVLIALWRGRGFSLRTLSAWTLGGLPFAAAEAFYNHRLYGHALATGYGNPAALFQLHYLAPTLRHYATWLPRVLTPLVPLALACPFLKAISPSLRWLLAVWILPVLAFYAFYSCTHETWWYLRFLLPAVPGLLLAAALTLQACLQALPDRAALACSVCAALVAFAPLLREDFVREVLASGEGNRVYRTASAWLAEHAPKNALVVNNITAGALTYYTSLDFAVPTTPAEAAAIESYATAARRPLYAVFFRFDAEPLSWFRSGTWEQVGNEGDLSLFRFSRAEAPAPQPAVSGLLSPALLPLPRLISWSGGRLPWSGKWAAIRIEGSHDPRLMRAVSRLGSRWRARPEWMMTERTGSMEARGPVAHVASRNDGPGKGSAPVLEIIVREEPGIGRPSPETYHLSVGREAVAVRSVSVEGILRGLATLSQLLTFEPNAPAALACLPTVEIDDAPRFPWRGLMIDVCRHWQPPEVILRTLDGMEVVKLNVLHLHLTDDQGFRIESRTHPELSRAGSDGLFFSQEEMRRIVAAAADRGIRVLPEFDLPGHATSWAVSHPELASAPGPYRIERRWGVFNPVLDPTKPELYALLNDFLGEMAGVFPDPFVHLGGDENNGVQWNANPAIQAFIRDHRLGGNDGLQVYFCRRVEALLRERGKRLVGWDEILNPQLPKTSVIQSWRGADGVIAAARAGFDVLRSQGYYLDLGQSAAEHYDRDPLPAPGILTADETRHVLGGEAAMWAEWVSSESIDTRLWPRAAAVAERLWSPAAVTGADEMYRRLDRISDRLAEAGTKHRSQPVEMARRLAARLGAGELAPAILQVSTAFVPLRGYDRGKAQPRLDQTQPLTTFADLVVPDPAILRGLQRNAARWRETRAPDAEAALRGQLAAWAGDSRRLLVAAQTGRWAEGADAAGTLAAACDFGLAILSGKPVGKEDTEVAFLRWSQPHAAVRLGLLPALRVLADRPVLRPPP